MPYGIDFSELLFPAQSAGWCSTMGRELCTGALLSNYAPKANSFSVFAECRT